jgi:hypothetical protein
MRTIIRTALICCLVALAAYPASPAHAQERSFDQRWQRADYPVQQGVAQRSWTWGPMPLTAALREAFADASDGRRLVQYFDKGRMELMPDGSVTSGLLVRELIEGRVQTGLDRFIPLGPAEIAAVGDLSNAFPTYADLQRIYRKASNRPLGERVTALLAPDGEGTMLRYASATASEIVQQEGGFGIPRVLWAFMNRRGLVYENGQYRANEPVFDWQAVVGLPVTEAYWVNVQVGGVEQPVLFQAFERRVLTYTPSNPSATQVEMGNVGQHYYQWRYLAPFANDTRAVVTVPLTDRVAPVVQSPLLVQGFESGNAFEGSVVVRLRNVAEGVLIARSTASVQRPDLGMAGPFSATLIFTPPLTDTAALLEVIAVSPQDGTENILDQRAVVLRAASAVPQTLVDQARQHLAARLGLGLTEIAVVETRYVEWHDASLGCPEPGMAYPQVITPGYQIVLDARGQQYTYHTDTLQTVVLCLNGLPARAAT